jgi:hypothetical protein
MLTLPIIEMAYRVALAFHAIPCDSFCGRRLDVLEIANHAPKANGDRFRERRSSQKPQQ